MRKTAIRSVTIEIDERLIEVLDYTLAEYDNVKIINEDILKLDLKKVIDDEFNGEKVSIAGQFAVLYHYTDYH